MVEVSCLFWEGMVSSLGNTAGPGGMQCHLSLCGSAMGSVQNLHHHVLVLLLSPPPLAQRGLLCPQSKVQSVVRAPCTTHTPLHRASSLHNPQGQGQGAQLWLMGPVVCVQTSKFASTVGWPHEK